MTRKLIYISFGVILTLFSVWKLSTRASHNQEFTEIAKLALRDAGNQLLLTNKDSTSLVLPIKALKTSKYRLSFEISVAIQPGSLVTILQNSIEKAELPNEYRVEVIQCEDNEVAYSFDMKASVDTDIIPCKGRDLPKECYVIDLRFTQLDVTSANSIMLYYLVLLFGIVFLALGFIKKPTERKDSITEKSHTLGSFYFYPEQNKLVKQSVEINLSKKECEILSLFVERPNQIIKRDELSKKVWEDNGVIVGRSLDTYISKLRKKLKTDESINLKNIHGVGYMLEMYNNN